MLRFSIPKWFNHLCKRHPSRNRSRRQRQTIERLEQRRVLSSYSVTSLLDTVDASPGDGVAADANGVATLRAAVMDANATAGADTITLGAGTFAITIAGKGENNSLTGDLDVTGDLVIQGAGANQTILDANLLDRYFHTSVGSTLTLRNLTIQNGRESSGGAIENNGTLNLENIILTGNATTLSGAAIKNNSGSVTLQSVTLIGNETRDVVPGGGNSIGGGISSFGGTLVINDSQFVNNVAAAEGGAIDARSTNLQVTNTAFSNNSATSGGAVRLFNGTATFTNDTWNGDHAVVSGGAITSNYCALTISGGSFTGNSLAAAPVGTVRTGGSLSLAGLSSASTIVNINGVTFQQTGSGDGGAIYNSFGRVNITNSTFDHVTGRNGGSIFNNQSSLLFMYNTTITGGTAELGGALYNGGQAQLYNNTVSNNTSTGSAFDLAAAVWLASGNTIAMNNLFAGNVAGRDASGLFTSQGGNVIGVGDWSIGFTQPTDKAGTAASPINPQLSPLADNGGPVKTMAISSLSPARDAGVVGGPAIKDARGLPRSGGITAALYDAGAYEYQNHAPVAGPFNVTASEDQVLSGQLLAVDADGDALTYEVTQLPFTGTLVAQPNGQFTYTPPLNFSGNIFFRYRVSDGRSYSNNVDGHITVQPVNDPPTVADQEFTIAEDVATGTLIGFVTASDIDSTSLHGETAVADATGAIAFSSTGAVYVADASKLDFETHPTITIVIRVVDDGNPAASAQATVTVHVTDVNDRPKITTNVYDVLENSPLGSVVATVQATDDDAGQSLTYEFVGSGWPFAINSQTGEVTVIDADAVGAETEQYWFTIVRVTDNGDPSLSTQEVVFFHLVNVNDPPTVPDQTFQVAENSVDGTYFGWLQATDPDSSNVFAQIVSGNDNGAIGINGPFLYVRDGSQLDFETTPTINLVVRVTDNNDPAASTLANVTINLTDANDPGHLDFAILHVDENSANGTIVGTVPYVDEDAVQNLHFEFLGGSAAYAIDPTTGVITVADSSLLDYESNPTTQLPVLVTDIGEPTFQQFGFIQFNLNDVNDAPTVYPAFERLDENSSNGTIVGSVPATDPDLGQSLTFAIVSGNAFGAFAINPATGQVTVANAPFLDFESFPSFTLTIRVTDNGSPALSSTADFTVTLNDLNESPDAIDRAFTLNENAGTGAIVGSELAVEWDAGQVLTFVIVDGNTGGAFAIDPATGAITVANSEAVDFESTPTFALTISVTDNGSPALSDTATVTIALADVNELASFPTNRFSITENTANGTAVGLVTGSDVDAGQTLTYAIVSGNTNGAFAINAATGQITVANSAALNYEDTSGYELVLSATDNGTPALTAFSTAAIIVTDVNEAPVLTARSFSLNENSANGTVVGSAGGTDPDFAQLLTYSIVSGNTTGAFAINAVTGQITVANSVALDFETTPSFSLIVRATDNGSPSLSTSATMTIALNDVAEGPVIKPQSFSIAENSANNTVVGTVLASNPIAGQGLTFAILSGNTGGGFSINSSTGQIRVANRSALDFETSPTFSLVVRATQAGSPGLSSTATIAISLTNVNEGPSIAAQTASIAENSANGSLVGTIVATDPDLGQPLTYSITSGNTNGAFAIDGATGRLTVANTTALNYEARTSFSLVVRVADNGSPSLSASATLTVNVLNVNEAPVVNAQSFSIAENSSNGTTIGTVAASDPDSGQSRTWSIVSGNTGSAFSINASTGQIKVANSAALDFETNPTFSVVVRATDNGTPNLSTTATMTISLTNINEAPVITAQAFSLAENSANGTVVGTVVATDPDAGQSLAYSIVGGNSNNAFAINVTTGRIAVANAAALDFEVTPTFVLQVQTRDSASSPLSTIANVTISLTDVFDSVAIDVVPGDSSNTIRLNRNFEVAILSTATFDARSINVNSVRFGKQGTEDSVNRNGQGQRIYSYRDVNGDGRLDLVIEINPSATGLKITDTLARLTAILTNGQTVTGSSTVNVRKN